MQFVNPFEAKNKEKKKAGLHNYKELSNATFTLKERISDVLLLPMAIIKVVTSL
jgi:hypothetical protein